MEGESGGRERRASAEGECGAPMVSVEGGIDLCYITAEPPDIFIFFFIKEDDIFRGQSRQIMSQPISLYLAKKIYHRGAPSFRGTMIDLLRDIGVMEGA